VIEVEGIGKRFGDVQALDGVSFVAADGKITGLLGPNGAGKSTCLRILSTVLKADRGSARIGGTDLAAEPLAARRLLGALPHNSGLYPQLSARENILYYGRLHGLDEPLLARRTEALIARLDLGAIADRKAKGFSQGERTKVAVARALIHEPQHVLLDEATSGLDVMATRHLRDWLRELRAQGRCILLSSHVMQEVEALVDELVIIAAGRVALRGTPAELAQRFPGRSLEEIFVHAVTEGAAVAASGSGRPPGGGA
jgi:sodium transport system ATP-binding protein